MLPHDKPVSEIITPNEEDENGDYWNPWDTLGLHCSAYSGATDEAAIHVLRGIGSEDRFSTDIAQRTGLDRTLVELLQEIFCSAGWCEYGTSPRGCWPIDREGWPNLIAAWEDYYRRSWGEEPPASAIEAGTAETERLSPEGESAPGRPENSVGEKLP